VHLSMCTGTLTCASAFSTLTQMQDQSRCTSSSRRCVWGRAGRWRSMSLAPTCPFSKWKKSMCRAWSAGQKVIQPKGKVSFGARHFSSEIPACNKQRHTNTLAMQAELLQWQQGVYILRLHCFTHAHEASCMHMHTHALSHTHCLTRWQAPAH